MTKTVLVPGVAWPYKTKEKVKAEKMEQRFANSASARLMAYIKEHPGSTKYDVEKAFPELSHKTVGNQLVRLYRVRRLDRDLVLIDGKYCSSYRLGERA